MQKEWKINGFCFVFFCFFLKKKKSCHGQKSKEQLFFKIESWGFPGSAVVKNLPANAGNTGSSPGGGRSHMPRSN